MACRGSALYLGFDQGRCAHLGSSGGRLNSNLPGSAWLLGVEPGTRFNSGSRRVRIDLSQGIRNVCAVPGREAKSLMGYPLPSFEKVSIQTNKQCSFLSVLC